MATKEERETIVNFTESDKTAQMYTTNKKYLNRLKKYKVKAVEGPDDNGGSTFSIPRNWLRIQRPAAETREWTEEQKEAARARLAKVREERFGKSKKKKKPVKAVEVEEEEEAEEQPKKLKKIAPKTVAAKKPVEVEEEETEDEDEEVEVVKPKKKK